MKYPSRLAEIDSQSVLLAGAELYLPRVLSGNSNPSTTGCERLERGTYRGDGIDGTLVQSQRLGRTEVTGDKHSRGQNLGRTQCYLQAKERFRRSVTLMIPRPWPFASRTVSRHLPVPCYCVKAMLVDAHDPPCCSISVAGEVCCWIWWAVLR